MKPRFKPRNPLVAPSLFRKAGEHRKSSKAVRRDETVKLFKDASAVIAKPRRPGSELTFLA